MKVGYRQNEWLAVYVDECGDQQIMPFDTYEQAQQYLKACGVKIGIITTAFYNHYIEKVIDE